jgi:hypothetical protein
MLKRVVAIFDATQKVRKSPGTLAGDGDLGHLEGLAAWGHDLKCFWRAKWVGSASKI